MKKIINMFVMLILGLSISVSAHAMGIRIEATSGGILEDAIFIASINGEPVRDAVALGDIDLSLTEHVFDVPVDSATTHWWLIGHKGGNVVYSSTLNLNGIDMYDVEPYIGAELAWNIPNNLDGFVNGTGFSFDWWAQTICNHHSHVTVDGGTSNLWLFSSPGSNFGNIAVNLHSNDIPPVSLPCEGDFDADQDVDGSDLAVFAADFGRTDCSGNCDGDFDEDGDVDGSDLAVFATDFGRTDCPQ